MPTIIALLTMQLILLTLVVIASTKANSADDETTRQRLIGIGALSYWLSLATAVAALTAAIVVTI